MKQQSWRCVGHFNGLVLTYETSHGWFPPEIHREFRSVCQCHAKQRKTVEVIPCTSLVLFADSKVQLVGFFEGKIAVTCQIPWENLRLPVVIQQAHRRPLLSWYSPVPSSLGTWTDDVARFHMFQYRRNYFLGAPKSILWRYTGEIFGKVNLFCYGTVNGQLVFLLTCGVESWYIPLKYREVLPAGYSGSGRILIYNKMFKMGVNR